MKATRPTLLAAFATGLSASPIVGEAAAAATRVLPDVCPAC
jgi:hypothetical protein